MTRPAWAPVDTNQLPFELSACSSVTSASQMTAVGARFAHAAARHHDGCRRPVSHSASCRCSFRCSTGRAQRVTVMAVGTYSTQLCPRATLSALAGVQGVCGYLTHTARHDDADDGCLCDSRRSHTHACMHADQRAHSDNVQTNVSQHGLD